MFRAHWSFKGLGFRVFLLVGRVVPYFGSLRQGCSLFLGFMFAGQDDPPSGLGFRVEAQTETLSLSPEPSVRTRKLSALNTYKPEALDS